MRRSGETLGVLILVNIARINGSPQKLGGMKKPHFMNLIENYCGRQAFAGIFYYSSGMFGPDLVPLGHSGAAMVWLDESPLSCEVEVLTQLLQE